MEAISSARTKINDNNRNPKIKPRTQKLILYCTVDNSFSSVIIVMVACGAEKSSLSLLFSTPRSSSYSEQERFFLLAIHFFFAMYPCFC